jgi:hypothetical protein
MTVVKQPILINDGKQAKFSTRYRESGGTLVSLGPSFEFDVTQPINKIQTDTKLGLHAALIDAAHGDGQPNIAQWLKSKQAVTGFAAHPQSNVTPMVRREGRLGNILPKLEQKDSGWTLSLIHQDSGSGYVAQSPTHIVTAAIRYLRQKVVDDEMKKLGSLAWTEKRQDVTVYLNDMDVTVRDDRQNPYGASFAVGHKSEGPLHIPQPKLEPRFGR